MKQFLKYTVASTLGVLIAGLILVLLLFLFAIASMSLSKTAYTPEDKTILHLKLEGNLTERTQDNPFDFILGNYLNKDTEIGLDNILSAIKKAKEHPNIKGIYMEAGMLYASAASVQEIRTALEDFKQSGKFIVVYGGTYLQNVYYASTPADKVIMNPQGMLYFKGLTVQPMFLKNTLDKLGVDMQIFKVGSYKSATETFSQDKMSEESREQVSEYVQSIWEQLLQDISADRKLPVDSLQHYADKMIVFQPAETVVSCGLVDTLMYANDVIDMLKEKVGLKKSDKIKLASIKEVASIEDKESNEKNKIAVVYATGAIDDGSSNGINSDKLIRDLKKIKENEEIKAVVLRINSPGGSAYGAEQIWQAINNIKEKKPVVVSMGDYAASGGYYIAAPANYIFAQPTTLTGSIGIFGIMPNMSGLYDKIGLSFDQVKTNKFSDMPNESRAMTEEEKAIMQRYVENGYNLFLSRCATGRNVSKDSINTIAQGRVWTGEKALKIGLVDGLGNLQDAIKKAAELADIEKYNTINYPEVKDFFTSLLSDFETSVEKRYMEKALANKYKLYDYIHNIQSMDYLQARLPFEVVVD